MGSIPPPPPPWATGSGPLGRVGWYPGRRPPAARWPTVVFLAVAALVVALVVAALADGQRVAGREPVGRVTGVHYVAVGFLGDRVTEVTTERGVFVLNGARSVLLGREAEVIRYRDGTRRFYVEGSGVAVSVD